MTKNQGNPYFAEKDSNSLIADKLAVVALEIFIGMVELAKKIKLVSKRPN